MELNLIGLTAALSAFCGIWFGHVAVRKIEFISPSVWMPAILFLLVGIFMEAGALLSDNLHVTTALGILGMTFLWDALEFFRQQERIKEGHAPANPKNTRHARILAECSSATTVDWLKRNPTGRQISPDELRKIEERAV